MKVWVEVVCLRADGGQQRRQVLMIERRELAMETGESAKKSGVGISQAEVSLRLYPSSDRSCELFYAAYARWSPTPDPRLFDALNGTSSGNGQIEIGNRWVRQLTGGHVHSDYLNYISIGICLVGDFNRDLPTQAQYQALDELIRYLRQRVGKIDGKYSIVLGHKEINPVPTDCPGNRHHTFPD